MPSAAGLALPAADAVALGRDRAGVPAGARPRQRSPVALSVAATTVISPAMNGWMLHTKACGPTASKRCVNAAEPSAPS